MTCTVTVLPAGRKLSAQPGENLLTLLRSANLAPEAPCGGNGKCGKCTVLIGGKPVLACGYTVSGDVTVHVTAAKTHARILTDGYGAEVELQPLRDGAMAAFDIGTTTVVCYLLEAGTGHLLAAASAVNPQQSYGADVISRIQRALAGEMEAQTRLIREQMGVPAGGRLPSGRGAAGNGGRYQRGGESLYAAAVSGNYAGKSGKNSLCPGADQS